MLARHPLAALGYDFAAPLLAGDHVTDDAGTGFVHTAPGHGREDFDIWTAERARALSARHQHRRSPITVDENGALTDQAPGFTGKRVHHRQGRKGRRQRGGDQGAGRSRHADRARPPEAPISAFVALEEAGDLPQHAAMVHRDGQADRGRGGSRAATRCAARARRHRCDALGAAAGREPHRRHDREPARLGASRASAPGACRSRCSSREGDGSVEILQRRGGRTSASSRRSRPKAPMPGTRPARASASSAASRNAADWKKVDDILDVWFDSGSTHAFTLEDPAISRASRASAARWTAARPVMYLEGSDQHRGWFHSSLLESCGTRGARAVRRRADPRLRARRARAQDVEVARQHRRAAGRDEAVRRRHPAPVGGAPPTTPTICASAPRSSRPRSTPTASCATPSAGCSATWCISRPEDRVAAEKMPELERLMLHRLAELDALVRAGLRRFRLQAHLRGAAPVHDRRSLGVLFRHPQGRALLRSVFVGSTRKAALTVIDAAVPLHRDLARADAVLHRRGSLAVALSGADAVRASRTFPRLPARWRDEALAEKWRKIRTRAPRRHRRAGDSSAPASASAPRSRPRPIVYVADVDLFAALVDVDLAGDLHHLGRDAGRRRGAGGSLPAATT